MENMIPKTTKCDNVSSSDDNTNNDSNNSSSDSSDSESDSETESDKSDSENDTFAEKKQRTNKIKCSRVWTEKNTWIESWKILTLFKDLFIDEKDLDIEDDSDHDRFVNSIFKTIVYSKDIQNIFNIQIDKERNNLDLSGDQNVGYFNVGYEAIGSLFEGDNLHNEIVYFMLEIFNMFLSSNMKGDLINDTYFINSENTELFKVNDCEFHVLNDHVNNIIVRMRYRAEID